MKSFLYFSSIIVSIAIIIGGHFYYKEKLTSIAEESQTVTVEEVTLSEKTEGSTSELTNDDTELTGLLKDWSEGKDTLSLTIFGSISLTNEEDPSVSWPSLLDTKLNEMNTYVDTTVIDVGRTFSIDVLRENYLNEVIESNPDVLLFEPFILNDNSGVRIEDSLEALEIMMQQFSTDLPDTQIILIPPNPLFGANHYLSQLDRLEAYATQQKWTYMDHWEFWPSTEDTTLNNYVENARPNTDGHALWAQAMFDLLTK